MDTQPLRRQRLQSRQLEARNVVAAWSESLTMFHADYHKVMACLQENKRSPRADKHLAISKCSPDRLVSLLMRMKAELQLLCQDIEVLAPLTPGSQKGFTKKLATHTKYLTQLNQQAFLLLGEQFPN